MPGCTTLSCYTSSHQLVSLECAVFTNDCLVFNCTQASATLPSVTDPTVGSEGYTYRREIHYNRKEEEWQAPEAPLHGMVHGSCPRTVNTQLKHATWDIQVMARHAHTAKYEKMVSKWISNEFGSKLVCVLASVALRHVCSWV